MKDHELSMWDGGVLIQVHIIGEVHAYRESRLAGKTTGGGK